MDTLYTEINLHLLQDEKPSIYLNSIIEKLQTSKLKDLAKLNDIEQELKYHPEGNVWNHIMLVIDEAAKVRDKAHDKKAFMWASLLHDLGKITTTKKRQGRWTSYNHDNVGADKVELLLAALGENEEFKNKVTSLVKHHMNHIYILKDLPFGDVNQMISDVDIHDMLLVFYCDSMGRGNSTDKDKEERLKNLEKIKSILREKYLLELQ